ncbi:cilia- and flagella-associated protein 70 [Neodiprion pinetum]|uniref:cilia- and flagella-associated protein 70 n=1 Tax=Neodiprion pinetum TaxID=441929 RepID=UPI0037105D08
MTKGKAGSKNEIEKENLAEPAQANTSALSPEESDIQKSIEITINSIENLSTVNMVGGEGIEVLIKVQHNDNMLGESPLLKLDQIEEDSVINIDYNTLFTIVINKESSTQTAVSTPILITALTNCNSSNNATMNTIDASGDASSKDKAKRSSALKLKNSKGNHESVILGICNFDLIPLFLGEESLTEKLILEVPSLNASEAIISWSSLPRLTVSARLLDKNIFPPEMNINFLTITVESIYNLPSSFTEDMDYKASTVVYASSEVPDDITFDSGVRMSVPDTEKVKCWESLAHLEGHAKFAKYKLNSDVTRNELKNDLDLKLSETAPRVQWNSMRRSLLLHSGSEEMLSAIKRYKYWPFFFNVSGKAKNGGKQKTKETDTYLLFQSYVDVSDLLYPGTTRTRVVARLHTFSLSAMAEQTGVHKSVFVKYIPKESIKEKDLKRRKSSTKDSSLPMTAGVSTETEYVPSFPVMSENGQSTFVIIEFELHHSLQPARTLADLTGSIDKMVHSCILPPIPCTSDLAEEQYSNCIRKLVDTLCEAYQDFIQNHMIPSASQQRPHKISSSVEIFGSNEGSNSGKKFGDDINVGSGDQKDCKYSYIKDDIACFVQYLHDTGSYLTVRSTLKSKIIMLLDQKFKIEMYMLGKKECQNFVATTYIYLVEQMHRTLNIVVEGQNARDLLNGNPIANASFFAEESCAFESTDDARTEYLNIIEKDKKNPDSWVEYAVYLLRIKDIDRATECCREAIVLDKKHKIALLLYGVILCHKEQYCDAEVFLQTVTKIYPRFPEGWAILHLFYLRTEYFLGADVTIQVALKCMKDKDLDSISTHFLNRDPLVWTALNYPKNRIYLVTAVLLLKMFCLDFAGIALSQELLEMGRTRHFLYFMATQHYMEDRYDDAICHLQELVSLHGMEYSVASLMGHCHLKVGSFDQAMYCYEFANCSFDRPEDLHLAQLRLGYLYLDTDKYEAARKLFLVVCKNSPTCRSWLGVGIASYYLNDMKNAEKSLTEANNLSMHNAEVWGYLCLVNMSLQRYDEFLQCYRQVLKNNLSNVRVWTMIKDLMDSLDYVTPMLTIDSKESFMHESPEFEGGQDCHEPDDN